MSRVPAALVVAAIVVAALAIASRTLDPHAIDLSARLAGPDARHLLGTDHLGRDLLARLSIGAGRTVIVLAIVLAACVSAGIAIGLAAAIATGATEMFLLRLMQTAAALPRLVIALAVTSFTGLGLLSAGLAIALTGWARYALVAHGLAREVMGREHWRAAVALGAHPFRAGIRHILPVIIRPMRAFAGADGARIVVTFSSLAFLGLGADTGNPDWGAMIWEYRLFLFDAPRLPLAPLVAIVGVALALQLLFEPPKDSRPAVQSSSPGHLER